MILLDNSPIVAERKEVCFVVDEAILSGAVGLWVCITLQRVG